MSFIESQLGVDPDLGHSLERIFFSFGCFSFLQAELQPALQSQTPKKVEDHRLVVFQYFNT